MASVVHGVGIRDERADEGGREVWMGEHNGPRKTLKVHEAGETRGVSDHACQPLECLRGDSRWISVSRDSSGRRNVV